ncbi:MAG: ATP-binding protein [Deltaproteobacteria bacterium]|nr:ATP-binding protein [Deltaproteobacteria bacterium]
MSPFSRPSFEEILESLPDAVLVITEGCITWGNAASRSLLRRDALAGLPLREVLAEGEDEHLGRLTRFWEQGLGLEGTHRILFVDGAPGEPLPAEVRLASAPSAPGGTYILSVRDARHPARVEGILGELASTAGSWDARLDFDRLIDLSEPIFRTLGWTVLFFEGSPEGARTLRIMSDLPRELPIWNLLDGLQKGGPFTAEQVPLVAELLESGEACFLDDFPHRLTRLGGIGVPLEKAAEEAGMAYAAWVPLRAEGEPHRLVVVVARDLTEYDFLVVRLFAAQVANSLRIGRLQRELVHRERLAAVGEMSAVLAHEVRNPLGVIFNVVGGLRRRLSDEPTLLRLVEILAEESERLKILVGDLLDYSRPYTPELQPVDLPALIDATLAGLDAVDEEGLGERELVRDFPEHRVEAELDPELLRRALGNLFLNAFQHTAAGGRIELSLTVRGGDLHLRVRNDGPAIEEEHAPKIFRPFFTTRPRGTGLGLAVARRIAEDLRGELVLESNDPVCFRLSLPLKQR